MFNDQIDKATRQLSAACEATRRLDGLLAWVADTESGRAYARDKLAQLADSALRRELAVVIDINAAEAGLAKVGQLLDALAPAGKVEQAARSLGCMAASIVRIAEHADQVLQRVANISAADLEGALSRVGERLTAAVDTVKGTFGRLQQAFAAGFAMPAPGALPEAVESTATSASEVSDSFSDAGAAYAHLLILSSDAGDTFYFNLSTAGFDALRRQTSYNVASQDRLGRRPALQAVAKGSESISLSGAVFTQRAGAGQLDKLRGIGFAMAPLLLITGYGETLGQWYLTRIDEDQAGLFADGMPRKQQFTLEFQRYGEDYSNI